MYGTVSRYTYKCKCNFIYGHKKSTAFAAPVLHETALCAALASNNKYEQYRWKLFYAYKLSMAFTMPTFTALTVFFI